MLYLAAEMNRVRGGIERLNHRDTAFALAKRVKKLVSGFAKCGNAAQACNNYSSSAHFL
jgi:hypothetical protein